METISVPTRRSPRSVERLFNGVNHPGFTAEQNAVLLALTLCSGWSADYISQKLESITGITLGAEIVWYFHWMWVQSRGSDRIDEDGLAIVRVVLSNVGVDLQTCEKPMNRFSYPVICSRPRI